jgi:hypothetical protein
MTEQAEIPLTRETIVARLEQELPQLREEVAARFGSNSAEAKTAIESLSQAQYILATGGKLEEALFQVASVRAMLTHKQNVRQWAVKWGSFLLLYALIWLVIFGAGFLFQEQVSAWLGETSAGVNMVRAGWLSALAGGVGGILNIFYELFVRVVIKKSFDRQYVMYYVAQPVMGFVLGAVAYFIIQAGFLVVEITISEGLPEDQQSLLATAVMALQIGVGFLAGFRQRWVLEMVDKIVQRSSSTDGPSQTK